MSRALALLLALTSIAYAVEEPLWTDGRGGGTGSAALNVQSFIKLARSLGPAVVNIVAISPVDEMREERPPGERGRQRGRGQGTGFVIQKSGYILTNAHVVNEAEDIRVRLADEREVSARLIGKDERTDIALLKVEAGDLAVAPLGNSDDLQIGEWVVAIGNPFGLDHTVTAGIVSAKGRRDIRPSGGGGIYDFIQTDASINPGNSGGPLINGRGEVIGMNTAMNAQAQGIGFAIPINMIKVIAPLLRTHGRVPRSWLGLYPQSVTTALKKAFGLAEARGALVSDVVADSPAARAGLQSGDVIVELDGKPIRRADDLTWQVATRSAGTRVSLVVLRGGKTMKMEAVLQAAPDETPPAPAAPKVPARKSPLGITVSEISSTIARELGNPGLHGVVVMLVEPESPAVEAGVERGDIIVRVGDAQIAALDDYARAVRGIKHGEMMRFLLRRENKSFWVAFPKR